MAKSGYSSSDEERPGISDSRDGANSENNALYGSTTQQNSKFATDKIDTNGSESSSDTDTAGILHNTPADDEVDGESMLLYRSDRDNFKSVQINDESRVSRLLSPQGDPCVHIVEAGKSNEGMANSLKKYVVYTIRLYSSSNPSEEVLTRRRYSDFESLRHVLSKIFPVVIVPPIPPKNYFSFSVLNGLVNSNISSASNGASSPNQGTSPHSTQPSDHTLLLSYSYINSKHLNKARLIDHRKRLLSNFLNNCISIPQIRNLDFFTKFLDPSSNWSDEIALISSHLPRSVYQLNPENGLKTDPIYSHLPLPTSQHSLGLSFLNKKYLAEKTTRFLSAAAASDPATHSPDSSPDEEHNPSTPANAKLFETDSSVKTASLDEINKKIMDNFIGISGDYVELGVVFNAFALILADSLKVSLPVKPTDDDDIKLDTIFDKIGVAFDRSYIAINALVSELETKFSEPLGEAVQYSVTLQSMKKYQRRKNRQKKLVDQEIDDKNKEIKQLMRANPTDTVLPPDQGSNQGSHPATTSPGAKSRLFPNMSSLKKITKYVSDIIDQNPEETRRQRIVQLQKKTAILEKCQTIMLQDIAYISDEMEKNLSAFQGEELKTIFKILLNYNSILMSWAKKTIDIWEEIKEEVKKF